MENLESRLSILERWRTTVEVALGKHEVDRDYINKRFDNIEVELKEIKSTGKQLNWMIYAAAIGWVIKYILDGGFSHL